MELKSRAYRSARSMGLKHEESEEVSQDIIVKFLEQPNSGQTVDQFVIDHIRHIWGRIMKDKEGRELEMSKTSQTRKAVRYATSIDEARVTTKVPDGRALNPRIGCLSPDALRIILEGVTDSRDRAMMILHYAYGFTEKEIGSIFGVSESRICQVINRSVGVIKLNITKKKTL